MKEGFQRNLDSCIISSDGIATKFKRGSKVLSIVDGIFVCFRVFLPGGDTGRTTTTREGNILQELALFWLIFTNVVNKGKYFQGYIGHWYHTCFGGDK